LFRTQATALNEWIEITKAAFKPVNDSAMWARVNAIVKANNKIKEEEATRAREEAERAAKEQRKKQAVIDAFEEQKKSVAEHNERVEAEVAERNQREREKKGFEVGDRVRVAGLGEGEIDKPRYHHLALQ
jgi:cysteinyl-tRNA synthetase